MWQQLLHWLNPTTRLPKQWHNASLVDIPLLAIDLELTSLDPRNSAITSIAWVAGKANSIAMSECFYQVVRTEASLEQSPLIHGLIAEHIAQGADLQPILRQLVKLASSHVWVFHNAQLDLKVLGDACTRYLIPLPTIVSIDTLQLALYQLAKQHQVMPPNSATLTVCRQRLDLPLAPAHNALDDALATMELLFAQLNQLDQHGQLRLPDLLHTGALKIS